MRVLSWLPDSIPPLLSSCCPCHEGSCLENHLEIWITVITIALEFVVLAVSLVTVNLPAPRNIR